MYEYSMLMFIKETDFHNAHIFESSLLYVISIKFIIENIYTKHLQTNFTAKLIELPDIIQVYTNQAKNDQ